MSKFLSVNVKDFLKGIIVAMLGASCQFVYNILTNGSQIDWQGVLNTAIMAGLAYVIKNYFTDDSGKLFGKI